MRFLKKLFGIEKKNVIEGKPISDSNREIVNGIIKKLEKTDEWIINSECRTWSWGGHPFYKHLKSEMSILIFRSSNVTIFKTHHPRPWDQVYEVPHHCRDEIYQLVRKIRNRDHNPITQKEFLSKYYNDEYQYIEEISCNNSKLCIWLKENNITEYYIDNIYNCDAHKIYFNNKEDYDKFKSRFYSSWDTKW